MRLDWENEVEVIKQGAAVVVYLFPNMFVTMGLTVLVVVLGMHIDGRLVALVLTLLATALAVISYVWVVRMAQRGSSLEGQGDAKGTASQVAKP